MGLFASIPNRGYSVTDPSWWNSLKAAGVALENWLGGGFISETHFALTNGEAVATSIPGLSFDAASYTSVRIEFEINQRTATAESVCRGHCSLLWRALTSTWDVVLGEIDGDESTIALTVATTGTVGQVQYTLGTLAGTGYVGNFKFKASTMGI